MKRLTNLLAITLLTSCVTAFAQEQEETTTEKSAVEQSADIYAAGYNKFRFGGYGEILANFMDYGINRFRGTDNGSKKDHRNSISIPRFVLAFDYKFNSQWVLGAEIEFEAGGTGSAYEIENTENGEYEMEVEKGGEVELEQFWIQKSFGHWANIKAGHIVVPVGLNNAYHEPLNFFTVYRPEGENTILPSTWHQTGVSFWGRTKGWRYELQFLAGLNSDNFTNTGWIKKGPGTPTEGEIATKYGTALRIDNYCIKGLRIGLSGYYGHAIGNSYPNNKDGAESKYKGVVAIGAIDFTYNNYNWIVRGQADYGYLSDAKQLKYFTNRLNGLSPFHHSAFVSKNAFAYGIEAGYNIFSQIEKLRQDNQKLYLFGRYEHYNPYASKTKNTSYDYTNVQRMALGINYYPVKQIVVKAEYSHRFLKSQYNNEPAINIGVAYEGWFL